MVIHPKIGADPQRTAVQGPCRASIGAYGENHKKIIGNIGNYRQIVIVLVFFECFG